MSDESAHYAVNAKVTPIKRLSGLWLIPLVTLAVGGWMVYDNWSKQGPLITIEFPTAEGLEAGRTKIKIREVDVGQVEMISLNESLSSVIVTARMNNEMRDLLVEGSRFWVVQPTVSLAGVSGLNTLLTGQYIRFSPGSGSRATSDFIGLDQPPLTPLGTPGVRITLTTDSDYSFAKGDAIHYQGINVGTVENVEFNFSDGKIYYSAFVEAPYHQLITNNTRFWKSSGIHAELTGDGFAIDTGTLTTLISGGISFITPADQFDGEAVNELTLFHVYPNRSAINARQYLFGLRLWVMVSDSIGGLSVDAPVTYRGVQIGKVLRTDYIPEGQTLLDKDLAIPVLLEINPGRLGLPDNEAGLQQASTDINNWISQGLQATIKAQNFLLGSQLVDLQYEPLASPTELAYFRELVVIPTGQDTLTQFTDGIEQFITKMNELPITELVTKLDELMDQGSATLDSIVALSGTGVDFLGNERNAALVDQLTSTMSSFEELAESFSSDSQTNQQILNLLQSISGLVEEFKPLVTELKNRPNGLIFPAGPLSETMPMRKSR